MFKWPVITEKITRANKSFFEGIFEATEGGVSAVSTAAAAAAAAPAEAEAIAAKTLAEAASAAAAAAQAAVNVVVSTPGVASGTVSLVNGERALEATGEKTTVGSESRYGAWSPDGRFLYTTSTSAKKLYVFERVLETGLTLIDEVSLGSAPRGVAVSPNGKYLHVADSEGHVVHCFLRNLYTGEPKKEAEVAVKNKAAAGAFVVHLAYSPDSKFLYVVGEEVAGSGNVYQFEVEATSKVKALTPELVASTELPNCNWVACTANRVYVAFEKGVNEFARNEGTGVLTKSTRRGPEATVNSIAVTAEGQSLYAACPSENKLLVFDRETVSGELTEKTAKTVEGCKAVCVTSDGKTVICVNNTKGLLAGFDRRKPAAAWELTGWTEVTAKELEPEGGAKRIVPNPDGVNVAVICETAKTVQTWRRYVRVKVTSAFVTEGSEAGRGIALNGQSAAVKGVLSPIKQVVKTSFYIESNRPSDTGTVLWSMPTESSPVQPVESPETGTFKGFTAANQPSAAFVPYAAGSVFNLPLSTASPVVIGNSQAMVNYALSFSANSPAFTDDRGSSKTVYYASSADPQYRIVFTKAWGANPAAGVIIHIPEKAEVDASGDRHMAVIQPDGTEYDFWEVQSQVVGAPGTITASWGGVAGNYATGKANISNGAATGGGFNVAAGIIRYNELAAAEPASFETINHGLFVVVKSGHGPSGAFIPPATHGDGEGPEESQVPYEGQRFCLMNAAGTALMSKAEIEAVTAKAWQRAVLSAFARYGCINGDKGGAGFGWDLENSHMYTSLGVTNPWHTYGEAHSLPLFEGRYVYKIVGEEGLTLAWWKEHLKAVTCKE